ERGRSGVASSRLLGTSRWTRRGRQPNVTLRHNNNSIMGLPSLVAICRFESDGRYSVKNERKGKSMNIDKCQYCGGSGEECFGCGGSGEYVKAFFKCGVEGCGHVVDVPDPLAVRAYDKDKRR